MNKAELFIKLEQMTELMGAEKLLNEICQGLSSDELYEALEYVDRMHDLNLFNDESEGD